MPAKTPDLSAVAPTRPAAPWLGGKRNLAKRICAIIDADARAGGHTTYAEPFIGMGGVFLRRTSRPRAEFINDRQREVYNLFRILQEHYVAFLDLLRFQITTQAGFERLVAVDPETLTDLQRTQVLVSTHTHTENSSRPLERALALPTYVNVNNIYTAAEGDPQ